MLSVAGKEEAGSERRMTAALLSFVLASADSSAFDPRAGETKQNKEHSCNRSAHEGHKDDKLMTFGPLRVSGGGRSAQILCTVFYRQRGSKPGLKQN